MDWNDHILVERNFGVTSQREEGRETIAKVRKLLNTVPAGPQEVTFDSIIDLTGNAAKFLATGLTIPAGSIVKYAGLFIETLVVGGGTTVKVALGQNAGTTNTFGTSGDLLLGTNVAAMFATKNAASYGLDLCGVTSAGTALGDTNLTAGKVRVVVIYDQPATLTA